MKRPLLVAGLALLVAVVGAWLWARTTLGSEAVRTDVATQLSGALGQPVAIGSLSPTLFPLSLTLQDVTVGSPPERITIDRIDVSAALGALFSRRVERTSVQVSGARVEPPLPAFTLRSASPRGAGGPAGIESGSGGGGLEIVSVDEVLIHDVVIVGGERTLTAQVDVVPEDAGLTIRRIELAGDDTEALVTGRLSDLSGPSGEVTITADSLNVLDLAAVAGAFGAGAEAEAVESPRRSSGAEQATPRSLTVTLEIERALVGPVALDTLQGETRLTDDGMVLDPLTFGLLGGQGEGSVVMSLDGPVPTYSLQASLEDVDVAQAATLAGKPDTMTGQLEATVDIEGQGAAFDAARQTAVGTAHVEATDGTVPGLGFVQTLSALTSGGGGLAGLLSGAASGTGSSADAYSRIGLSLDIADGLARTDDFRFDSSEVLITAAGTIALDGSAVDLTGQAQLSNGMTAPARVTGTVTDPQVQVEGGDLAGSIDLENIDPEDAMKSLLGGLGSLLGR